jgi:hypothetical protein
VKQKTPSPQSTSHPSPKKKRQPAQKNTNSAFLTSQKTPKNTFASVRSVRNAQIVSAKLADASESPNHYYFKLSEASESPKHYSFKLSDASTSEND